MCIRDRDEAEDELEFKEGEFILKKVDKERINAITRNAAKKHQTEEEVKKELIDRRNLKEELKKDHLESQKIKNVENRSEFGAAPKIKREQRKDPYWSNMIKFLMGGKMENFKRHEKI